MEITIKATPEEAAALVVAIQERRAACEPPTERLAEMVRGLEVVKGAEKNNVFIHSLQAVVPTGFDEM